MNHRHQNVISSRSMLILMLCINAFFSSIAQLNVNNLTAYTERDGLPGSYVNRVLVDKLGYIWVGTINGLARYDGYEFKRFYYDPNDPATIHGSIVWSMYEDSNGQLWIACGPSFLNKYDPTSKSFKQYEFQNLIKHPPNVEVGINAICEDNNHRIYFGVHTYYGNAISSALLYKDENDEVLKIFTSPDSVNIQNVISLTKDNTGNIWCLSYSGIFKIDTKGNLTRADILENQVLKTFDFPTELKFDKDGHIWLITSGGRLYDFNNETGEFNSYATMTPSKKTFNDNNSALGFDKDDNIWLGTNAGIKFFNRRTKEFSTFKDSINQSRDRISAINFAIDPYGTIWIATIGSGLLKYEDRPQIKSYVFNKQDKRSITQGWVNNIIETSDGKIWISTSGGWIWSGLNMLDIKSGLIKPIPYSTINPELSLVYSIWEKAPGELYLSSLKKVFSFSTRTHKARITSLPGAPDSITIYYHYKDAKENEWLLALDGLYKKEKSASQFKKYVLRENYIPNPAVGDVTGVYESEKHGLWLLTNNGLFLYNYNTDKIERHGYDKKKGDIFVTQDINSFYEDPDGIAWVGTWQGGLGRYNVETKKIRSYTRNDGLPSMSIQGILSDEKNNALWLSTFDGLSRFDLKTGQFINFSVADGIQGQLFADGSSLKTSSGLLIFGGSNGISIVNPGEVNIRSTPPRVFITELRLFNQPVIPGEKSVLKKPIYETGQIILAHNQNNITLEFLAGNFSNPLKNKYSYKLENYDNDWRDVGNQHEAFYPSLPPGEYTFRVKAANDKGIWNQQGATLKIVIMAPWWKTSWAYLIYAFLLAAFGFGLNRYFHRRSVQKEKERSRIRELEQAREIEKAYYKLEEAHEALKATQNQLIQSEKMASLGDLTAGIAHEIQNPLNFVNNFSEINSELIAEVKHELDAGNKSAASNILHDIEENTQKIYKHGKRADSIVKGMLLHSRISTGQKELTDINAIADEYLRLSYHGLRAKDNKFHVNLKTAFDPSLGRINVVPQDISRVLLNLYNNAFYAVTEKQKSHTNGYEPLIEVSTKNIPGKVQIKVKDNGSGIPAKLLDKIFEPFFTTKPAGKGTGLGLSTAYEFITKGHGGELMVESKEGEGSEFIIQLPTR
ncbi:MAG: two-component regulator propeller domain-containing protein [Chitinophagales bacterium]